MVWRSRATIALKDGVVLHNGEIMSMTFTPNTMMLGCTNIDLKTAKHILKEYKKYLKDQKGLEEKSCVTVQRREREVRSD